MSSRGCVDWLASRVVLSRTLLELKAHEALVANHPRIVTGFDHIRISRRQLEKDFLVQHFKQHYVTIVGSLLTWRQIPDWLDGRALPEWVLTGKSS